ncbi:type I methionyl aminopeptidase [Propionibacterium freudenreichii]|uniref:type I methionyl aminopeptidase n=1 Tax=Propionibacterium freudenreichii TaxID=1744 RepID=UPI00054295C2|nr:type I methionyl aminopeptidase [Propionibacterium freudenreichii]MCT2974475.1 type I methionyl aminopeptidase [Propionibacterium freudenreichii]MCT2999681.1 type I methionyl aminopeptidase [Propionibacterium freudenreichii]MCT3016017.1 type I methionyl aminopeptidase [Propionibacterium freudenreichii]MDK9293931.1 type I methionyl aminopeptidase [Propionibacterium freudenreichii]MDK9347201.1 type I methionyl aminopeptidase [Propionibacterium freudenreichii]
MTAIKPYPQTEELTVPADIERPPYVGVMGPETYTGSDVQSSEIVEKMRIAGRIAADAILVTAKEIAPGVTTDHLDKVAHEFMLDHHAWPATLDYRGFPKSLCTSVNEVICHGIPDLRPLEEGDIVKLDVTSYIDGVHGDNCATYYVGEVDEESKKLTEVTRESMYRGIKACKPGRPISVIGRVIESYAKRFDFGVVREYTGHGVHTAFHSGLIILHYDEPRLNTPMQPGMTFTIEPMLTVGSPETEQWDDGWTVVTRDGSRSAQFEQTLVVTDDGTEILTLPSSGQPILGGDPTLIDLSDIH